VQNLLANKSAYVKNNSLNFRFSIKFLAVVIISVMTTLFLANHFANILFGKNSAEVYTSLKQRKQELISEIRRLQLDNARLQKEYFELKNLEPEE